MDASPLPNEGRVLAYSISGLTTLLWVACVLPSGTLSVGGMSGIPPDLATPMYRESVFLVPALMLLIVGPAGLALARTRLGLLAVLAGIDAFVASYAAVALAAMGAFAMRTSGVLVGLLFAFGALSLVESVRLARAGPDLLGSTWRGLRLALCMLVLLTPSSLLFKRGHELASLLAPFALLAISTGGAVLARTIRGLRLTAALLYLALAMHVFVTLRYTLFDAATEQKPAFVEIGPVGWATLGLSLLILLLALGQVLRIVARLRAEPSVAAIPGEVS